MRHYLAAPAVVLVAALAGCSLPVSAQYIDGGKFGVSIAVPSGYATFDAAELGAPADEGSLLLGFGGPGVTPASLLSSSDVGGVMRVVVVPGDVETADEQAINVFVDDMNAAIEQGKATVVAGPEVSETAAQRSISWTLKLKMTGAEADSLVRVVSHIGLADADASDSEAHVVKSLAVGCLDSCYSTQERTISAIEESWRIT